MIDRSQSNVVGVILLVSVVTLTVTASGAVVLSDWEADIGPEPVADLDSEVTAVTISVDHRGGETLDPDQTRVEIIGSDETASLDETLEPGGSTEWEFDRLDDSIQLVIVDEPTNTVLHRNSHTIVNPIEGLRFGVDGWTEPIYLLEGHPANYTVAQEFELGTPHPVTERANVTVEDESVTVDEGETTLEGSNAGVEVTGAGEFNNRTTESEIVVLESDPSLEIETEAVNITSITTVNATADLADLGGLPEVDIYFEYSGANRTFVEDSADNADKLIADGSFYTDPDGYAHDGDYVHDNVQFEPGDRRTYILDEAGSGADLYGSLRTAEQTSPDGGIDSIDEVDNREEISTDLSSDEIMELDVEYASSGSEFQFSIDGQQVATWDDLESHDELYFSTYEWAGSSGSSSLRLIGADPLPENIETTDEISLSEEEIFNEPIDGFSPYSTYGVRAFAEQEIGGTVVDARGEWVQFSIDGPTVETTDTEVTNGTSANVTGELTDIGDLDSVAVSFKYWEENRTFVGDSSDNADKLIADGSFYTDPDGYAHDGDYVHDNVQFEPGDRRTYILDEAGSGADLYGSLRTAEQTSPDGGIDSIDEVDNREEISTDLSSDEIMELDVEYASSGSEFRFSIDGQQVATWDDLESHDELYFSTYEWAGDSGSSSLRLTGADPLPENIETTDDVTLSEGETFNETIGGLSPYTSYGVRAATDAEVDGVPIVNHGDSQRFSIDGPTVETVSLNATGPSSIDAEGELTDIGDLDSVAVSFKYWEGNRTFVGGSADNADKLIADGSFHTDPDGYAHDGDYVHDNVQFEPGDRQTYVLDEAGSGADLYGSLRTAEQTSPDGGIDSIDEVDNREEISTDISSGETSELDVEYASSGSEFRFSIDGQQVTTWGDLESHDELYFSTYEWAGSSGSSSLRLIGVDALPENIETTDEITLSEGGTFSEEIDGLDPETEYSVRAITDQNIDEISVVNKGGKERETTEEPSP